MVDQMGEYLKETQKNINIILPKSIFEILKTAPQQEQTPRELVEWIKQVIIEGRHNQYDGWLRLIDLMRTIAIQNYYSPKQYQRAEERASLELQNRTYGKQISSNYQKLTN